MKIEKLENNHVKYTFKVEPSEFEIALNYAFDRIKKDVEVKGFRKGHVTRSVYETKFGVESLYEEALNFVFHSKYHEMIDDKTYEIVGEPVPSVKFEEISATKEFEVSLEAAVKPEVKLGKYQGIEVPKLELVVDIVEVDERIEKMLEENNTLEVKEGAIELGDTAIFDFDGSVDGVQFEGGKAENYQLEIGSGQFIPGFEDQMVGLKAGDEKDVLVTFPNEYHETSLAGKEAVFAVKVHEVKAKVKTELTDEWVESLGGVEKTVLELRGKVQAEIKETKERNNKNQTLQNALDELAKTSKVDIPVEMIDYEINQQKTQIENQAKQYGLDYNTFIQITGMTEEQLNEQLRSDSEIKVLNSLLIEAVAKAENFEVSKDDLDGKYIEIATMYQMDVTEVKKHLNDEMLTQDIKFAKALDFIYDNLKFV